jgi:hypothetical protein
VEGCGPRGEWWFVSTYVEGDRACVCCASEGWHLFGCPGEAGYGPLAYDKWLRGHSDAMAGKPARQNSTRYKVGYRAGERAVRSRGEGGCA